MSFSSKEVPNESYSQPAAKIMQAICSHWHQERDLETGELYIASFIEELRREAHLLAESLSGERTPLMETGTAEQKAQLLEGRKKAESENYNVKDPHKVVTALNELADLLETAKKSGATPDKDGIVRGLADGLIPVLHWNNDVLNDQNTLAEESSSEQYVTFLKHAGSMLTDWCEHPDIKAVLPKNVREHFKSPPDITLSPRD